MIKFAKRISLFMYFSTMSLCAQNSEFKAEISSTAIISSQKEIPFWLRANTSNEFTEFTNFTGVLNGLYSYQFSKGTLEAGAYIYARDGFVQNVQRRDLYLQYRNNWLKVTAGAKQSEEAFFGVSSTNQNYLYSNNARPFPGVIIEANKPFKLFNIFKIDWGVAHYQLNDERYVTNTRIHYKRLNVITKLTQKSEITLGIQHFVQWAGTSPEFGKLRSDLSAFGNVFIAKKSSELGTEGEVLNAVGNHLGSFLFRYDLDINEGKLGIYHEHPFEDGSGTGFKNFPDGVWGISFKPNKNKFIKGILYEYQDTRSQSKSDNNNRVDNYFTNLPYRSGWTYEKNIIGSPFFKIDKNIVVEPDARLIIGSRFQVHHIGLAGEINSFYWKLKMSYSKNLGVYGLPFVVVRKDFYSSVNIMYTYKLKHQISFLSGLDISNTTNNIVAAGVSYKYQF